MWSICGDVVPFQTQPQGQRQQQPVHQSDAYSKCHSNHENFISNYVGNSSVTTATALVRIENNDVTPLNVLRLRDNGEM